MNPPSRFEIMRRNRAILGYTTDKARILEEIDCAELHVLRTLRDNEEEVWPDQNAALMDKVSPPLPPLAQPATSFLTAARVEPERAGLLRRCWNWRFGFGGNA